MTVPTVTVNPVFGGKYAVRVNRADEAFLAGVWPTREYAETIARNVRGALADAFNAAHDERKTT